MDVPLSQLSLLCSIISHQACLKGWQSSHQIGRGTAYPAAFLSQVPDPWTLRDPEGIVVDREVGGGSDQS